MVKTGKTNRKVLLLPGLLLCMLLGGCSQFQSEAEAETELKANQRYGKITVVSITGNELTYYEETEAETEAAESESPSANETAEQTNAEPVSSGRQRPDMSQFGRGERPDMSQFGGEMPDMSHLFGGTPKQETKTVYLPVSIVVHTDRGDKTFSILEDGDELEVLFEENENGEEIITEIWMEGSSR